MEEALEMSHCKDTKERMAGVERLNELLEASRKSLTSSEVTSLVDCCLDLLKDNNFSGSQGALQVLDSAAVLSGEHLKLHFNSLVPATVDRLGDAKQPVRDAARRLFLTLMQNVWTAGTDTAAASVVWSMTSLMKNPKVLKKAQEEVRNVIGKKGKIDEDDLPKLTYLMAVIKETIRLYPPSPILIPRESMKDTILNSYIIKQKTTVYVNAYDFFPERFLNSDIDFKGNDLELIPFGAGRRICPGMSMGVVMVELLLANLLCLFDWDLPDDMKKEDIDLDAMPGITTHKRNELCLVAHLYF